ncbi:MAG: glycosyltransferase [Gammaproteobacteria bacterium]
MSIDVLICTRDNADSLRETLDSVVGQEGFEDRVRALVVVDNGSSDHTAAVIDALAAHVPKMVSVFEARKGLQHAKNAGLAHCDAELTAMTDDDCLMEPGFLMHLDHLRRERPEVGLFGGRVIPLWARPRPDWLDDRFLGPLAMLDLGDAPVLIGAGGESWGEAKLVGANYAIRREAFERHGRFNEGFEFSQDVEICTRMIDGGERALYDPALVVQHKVPEWRMEPGYFYRWSFRRGHFSEQFEGRGPEPRWFHPLGVPPWMWRKLLRLAWRIRGTDDPAERVWRRAQFHYERGAADARYRAWRGMDTL